MSSVQIEQKSYEMPPQEVIQACHKRWKSRGAEFITEPLPKYGEIRCYIRDPDGYIIEVGQNTDQTYG